MYSVEGLQCINNNGLLRQLQRFHLKQLLISENALISVAVFPVSVHPKLYNIYINFHNQKALLFSANIFGSSNFVPKNAIHFMKKILFETHVARVNLLTVTRMTDTQYTNPIFRYSRQILLCQHWVIFQLLVTL